MSNQQLQNRLKRIKWTIKIIHDWDLKMQTVQFIFYFCDVISLEEHFNDTRQELLVVASIYMIMKIQGDLTSDLVSFNEFVQDKLKIDKTVLIKMEMAILPFFPKEYIFWTTFSDYFLIKQPDFDMNKPVNYDFLNQICSLSFGYYLFCSQDFELESLLWFSILKIVDRNEFGNEVLKNIKLLKNEHSKKEENELNKSLQCFAENENRYIHMLFKKQI